MDSHPRPRSSRRKASATEDPFELPNAATLGRLFSRRRTDPDRDEPPLVRAARERDAAARLRLLKGHGYREPRTDYATALARDAFARRSRR